jgi:hypothetical protein
MSRRSWVVVEVAFGLRYPSGHNQPSRLIIQALTLSLLPLHASLIHWHCSLCSLLVSEVCFGLMVGFWSGTGFGRALRRGMANHDLRVTGREGLSVFWTAGRGRLASLFHGR